MPARMEPLVGTGTMHIPRARAEVTSAAAENFLVVQSQ